MECRRVYLPSPREPSGATWLINCLLELGIRTFRDSPDGMWRFHKGRWRVNAHEEVLRKWLPALSDRDSFVFREDIEVQWMHNWRTQEYSNSQIVYFVRDPRDALFSRYKREAPNQTFAEFVAFPDVRTLLDKVITWRLFNEAWLSHPAVTVVRFEDYKMGAESTLNRLLLALGLDYSAREIHAAVQASTFERAAEAERNYRAEFPHDTQLINRSGKKAEWMEGEIDTQVVDYVNLYCADILTCLGYPSPVAEAPMIEIDDHAARLGFFRQIVRENSKLQMQSTRIKRAHDLCAYVQEFVSNVDNDMLERASLPAYELKQLNNSLTEYFGGLGSGVEKAFRNAAFSRDSGSEGAISLSRLGRGFVRKVRRFMEVGAERWK